jgi:hypothetical protein
LFWYLRERKLDVRFTVQRVVTWGDSSGEQFRAIEVVMTNAASASIWYYALSSDSPDYFTYSRCADEWRWNGHAGRPATWFTFPGGARVVFLAGVPDDASAVKIGVPFANRFLGEPSEVVWSEVCELSQLGAPLDESRTSERKRGHH